MAANVGVEIIGAGGAVCAAARRLAASHLSAIVLEATARVGGEPGPAMSRPPAWTQRKDIHRDHGREFVHTRDACDRETGDRRTGVYQIRPFGWQVMNATTTSPAISPPPVCSPPSSLWWT